MTAGGDVVKPFTHDDDDRGGGGDGQHAAPLAELVVVVVDGEETSAKPDIVVCRRSDPSSDRSGWSGSSPLVESATAGATTLLASSAPSVNRMHRFFRRHGLHHRF